jgi:protein-tyrosine phosphatase
VSLTAPPARETLCASQRARLERFGVSHSVDLHCHCLPGLDDGVATMDDAIELCRELVADGVTTVVATPHQLGRYADNSAVRIRRAASALQTKVADEQIPLHILPGADVRLDERLLKLVEIGEVLSIADRGRYLLLELPHELFVDPQFLLAALLQRGVVPVLTHLERYRYLRGAWKQIRSWISQGAVLQITAGSLLGDFGRSAREMAWQLARQGVVDLVATDAHDAAHRRPRMTAAIDALTEEFGLEFTRRVCLANPLHVLEGNRLEGRLAGQR